MDKKILLVDLCHVIWDQNQFTKKEIDYIKQFSKENTVLFFILGERFGVDDVNKILKIFFENYANKNIILLCDRLFTDHDISRFIIDNIIVVDSQLLKVAQYDEKTQFNSKINLDSNRFLFLMGKPYKQNRLPFLYELYKNDLLKHCNYSFYCRSEYAERTRNIMNFLSDTEYDCFIKNTQKVLDNIEFTIGHNFFNYNGLPVDPNLYKKTAFSVISESTYNADNFTFISEKTWRTIANKHMFISITPKIYKDYLNSLGIQTFDYCLKYTKEDLDFDDIDHLNRLTVENVKFLLKNIKKHKNQITKDIYNNYLVYKKLISAQRKVLSNVIENELYISDCTSNDGYKHMKLISISENLLNKTKQNANKKK
jgi:DNA-directed RNA polymerase beta subunit